MNETEREYDLTYEPTWRVMPYEDSIILDALKRTPILFSEEDSEEDIEKDEKSFSYTQASFLDKTYLVAKLMAKEDENFALKLALFQEQVSSSDYKSCVAQIAQLCNDPDCLSRNALICRIKDIIETTLGREESRVIGL